MFTFFSLQIFSLLYHQVFYYSACCYKWNYILTFILGYFIFFKSYFYLKAKVREEEEEEEQEEEEGEEEEGEEERENKWERESSIQWLTYQ